MNIYIDADACPVKNETIKVAARYRVTVYLVSNQGMRDGLGPNAQNILVGPEFDAADNWIADHAYKGDIVITNDIPLAGRCVQNGVHAITPAGRLFTAENIGAALASRDLNAYLREAGEISSCTGSFSRSNRSSFLQTLDTCAARISSQKGRPDARGASCFSPSHEIVGWNHHRIPHRADSRARPRLETALLCVY